jgi:ATP-dependent Clp protease ATP-binding subunit ClpA
MAYDKNDKDFIGILSLALGEAQDARQLHAGTDHIFLSLLQQRYAPTNAILIKYEDRVEEVRKVVKDSTKSWRFRKFGKVRTATISIAFKAARDLAKDIWRETHESTTLPSALSVLEAILVIREPRLMKILDLLQIDPDKMIKEIQLRRPVVVEN